MSRDVITVGLTMRILLLYQGEYSQWHERFMNYLEEQTDGEAMTNSIQNGDQPLHVIDQVSLAGTAQNAPPTLKDPKFWTAEQLLDTYLHYLQVINDLKKCRYKKDNYVNDALGYKKKAVVLTSDPLALVAEKANKITALLAKAFNRRKFYSKPTNSNLRTSSTSQSANKKQEFVKTDDKKVDKKADEKKRDMSKVNETVFQACSGQDVSSVRVNMETLAPRLWIDANVIECWVAILNHEELVKGYSSPRRHFFQPTKAIIERTIDEEQQWKLFSYEISKQFKHDVSFISLFEVDLAFFPNYASGHFYVVVFHLKSPLVMIILDNSDCGETCNLKYKAVCKPLKQFFARHLKRYNHPKHNSVSKLKHRIPKLKWSTTKNHSDCRVFTMMHLEHYFGKPVGQWDFGLCEELNEQVSMLRRMRFKIAAKILLNEFNIYSEKMFDLAFKLETENDEQKRISIIVNAIKNMNELDPAKKTLVENQEEDALKNK
nr:hypothetical protein [Tanacetum cinerariifolium]